jgi:hypothetical protein
MSQLFLCDWQNYLVKALEVCEGQQWDVDFETRDDVTIPEYLKISIKRQFLLLQP